MTSPRWHLTLHRRGSVRASGGELLSLGSKVAGLLAYLAVEGPTLRSTLAGLLWPEVTEATARNNLSQALGRHRTLLNQGHDRGGQLVQLSADVDTDVHQAGDLLLDHEFADAPDFMEWLVACRERFRQAQLAECRDEVLSCEQRGDFAAALRLNARLLALDELSEEAHRRQMRLHYLLGDRASALAAYHHCQAVLRRELGVDPLPETAKLASQIGQATFPTRPPARSPLPLSVQRPPTLIGREHEWAAMQAAWDDGKHILLSGDPGVGKTRLMRDFVNSHGGALHFEGRPGDLSVPYSSQARTMARMLRPDLVLPSWVRPEMARLLPELGEALPITNESQRLRFYQAMTEVVRASVGHESLIVAFDDLHFADPASLDAGQYISALLWSELGPAFHGIHCTRRGMLSLKMQSDVEALLNSGRLVQIEVPPLDEVGVTELVESLKVEQLEGQDEQLYQATGGNPLFVLETVRSWLEQDAGQGGPALFMPGGKTQQIIAQRLARLSPEALKLARAAAVLAGDLNAERASCLLKRDPLDLSEAWAELELAQMLRSATFTHDLLFEAVYAATPLALRELLHERAAGTLEASGGPPARVAEHWQAAGQGTRAAPWLVRAAEAAEQAYRLSEATDLYERAAALFEAAGQTTLAFDAYEGAVAALRRSTEHERIEAALERLLALARTPGERARSLLAQAERLAADHLGVQAEVPARAGLAEAALSGDLPLQAKLMGVLVNALWIQRRGPEARQVLDQQIALVQRLDDPLWLVLCQGHLGSLLEQAGQFRAATACFQQAIDVIQDRPGEELRAAGLLENLSVSWRSLGAAGRARDQARQALEVMGRVQGAPQLACHIHAAHALADLDLGDLGSALKHTRLGLTHTPEAWGWVRSWLHGLLVLIYTALGAADKAGACLPVALMHEDLPPHMMVAVWLAAAGVYPVGPARQSALAQAERAARLLLGLGNRAPLTEVHLARARLAPAHALDWAGRALTLLTGHDLPGLEAAAHWRLAGALLGLNQAQAALDHARAAMQLSQEYRATSVTRTESQDLWQRVLAALGHPEARAALQGAVSTLREVAEQHVPEEYRAAFLWQHPVHRNLLERAALADIETPARPALPGHLTDAQWSEVQLLVAAQVAPGRPRSDDRSVLEGVLWKLATEQAWRELPPGAASFATCHRRQQEWRRNGALRAVLLALANDLVRQGGHEWKAVQAPSSWQIQTLRLLCVSAVLSIWQGGAQELAAGLTEIYRQMNPAQ